MSDVRQAVNEHEGKCDVCGALHWRSDLRGGLCKACLAMAKGLTGPSRRVREPWTPLSQRSEATL